MPTEKTLDTLADGLPGENSHWVRPNTARQTVYNLVSRRAEVHVQGNTDATTIAADSIFYEAVVTGAVLWAGLGKFASIFSTPAAGRLQYDGLVPVEADFEAKVSFSTAATGQEVYMRIAKNGVTIASSEMQRKTGTTDIGFMAAQCLIPTVVEAGDYFSVFVANFSTAGNITIRHLNLRGVFSIL